MHLTWSNPALIAGIASIITLVLTELFKRFKTSLETKAVEAEVDVKSSDALATAFQTISESLKIIHDLRIRLGEVEADLIKARTQIRALESKNHGLEVHNKDLMARLDMCRGDVRQLKQVLSSQSVPAPLTSTDTGTEE